MDIVFLSRKTTSAKARGFLLDDSHDVRTRERIYLDHNLSDYRSRCLASTDKLKVHQADRLQLVESSRQIRRRTLSQRSKLGH